MAILEFAPYEMCMELSAYTESLYNRKKPFTIAKLAFLAVQDKFRNLRKQLNSAWEDLETWRLELPVNTRRPSPRVVAWALMSLGLLLGTCGSGNGAWD